MSREHPRYERVRPPADRVLRVLAQEYGVKLEAVLQGRRGRENEARKVGMYFLKRLCDLTLQEIADRFGIRSYGAAGWACHGVRSRIESDRKFQGRIERLQALICQQKI